jgi:translocation and assembly module TamB
VRRAARLLFWSVLGLCAAVAVTLSAVAAFAATPGGKRVVARLLIERIDAALAGRLALEGFEVLPGGGVELRGLEVWDPDGHLVLQVSRARLSADLTRLRSRAVGLVVELDGPSVLLESEPDGGLSLLRALAPATPSPPEPPGRGPSRPSWTLRLTRLSVRQGDLWWRGPDGVSRLEASGVGAEAEGAYGPAGGFAELRLRADLAAPVEGPAALDLAARLEGDRLTVPVLAAALGETRLEGIGEADLRRLAFRAAVTRLGVARADVARAAPGAPLAGDLEGTLYAESDGARATAAADVRPVDGAPAGEAVAAAAVRLPPAAAAAGFELTVRDLDPSRLVAQAPPGRLSLAARGAASGRRLAEARGRIELDVAPSRLRRGTLGPITVRATADRGRVEVPALDARLPGLAVTGSGRWRAGGAVGGALVLDASDLARLGEDLAALGLDGLPPLAGRAKGQATLAGTASAPALSASVEAPAARLGELRLEGARLALAAAGPAASAKGSLDGTVARALLGATEARGVAVGARLEGDEATVRLAALLPEVGKDPVTLQAGARLARDRRTATLHDLTLGWPGTRYALARPAELRLDGPSVDRLELGDGERRLALSGGLGPREALDARLEVSRLDLARLPRGLVPADLGLAGDLSADARASGTVSRPRVEGSFSLEGGEARGLAGLEAHGTATWDGAVRRLAAALGLRRRAGGTVEATADLPLPLARSRRAEPVALTVAMAGWPIAPVRSAAALDVPVSGTGAVRVTLGGTAAAPTLAASVELADLSYEDLGPFAVTASLDDPGTAARLSVEARHAGARLAGATAALPLDVGALLADPAAALRALATAPLQASLDAPGADLAPFAGRSFVPEGIAGTLSAAATLTGTLSAPRGTVALGLRDGAAAGYAGLAGSAELELGGARTALALRTSAGGDEALRLTGSLGAPVERLLDRAALRRAALALEGSLPPLSLARATGAPLALAGTVALRLTAAGTLADPTASLDADGAAVLVEGRPLGDVQATARYAAGHATAEVAFRATAGGTLTAAGALDARLGLDADASAVARAPARLRVTAQALDLGVLPALLPGLVRSAAGPLTLEVAASGPLDALAPRGSARLERGRLAVTEYGEWTELALEATLDREALLVPTFAARRGGGRLAGSFALRDLAKPAAALEGSLRLEGFTLARAGMDLARIDGSAALSGTLTDRLLDATLTVPGATVKLPRKTPRALQSLERRADIQVGRPRPKRPRPEPAAGAPAEPPFEARLRLVMPGKLFVRSDNPRVDLEVKGDTTWRLAGGELTAEGPMEVVRGTVEPIGGRVFVLDRGRVQFTGGGWRAGLLDVAARWENPIATVTVVVDGPIDDPKIQLSSRPPLDDATIAMLIATGRTELKAGTSDVGSLTAKDAGMAAAGAAASLVFKDLLADKLPVDSIALDSTAVRAGKYLPGGKIFIAYVRRFEARPDKGENPDEVRVEYQISPRWTFESRYGNAQSGGASLIWSRDY